MPQTGEETLAILLREMEPVLSADAYTFCVLKDHLDVPRELRIFAMIHEAEGVTIVAPELDVTRAGLEGSGAWARISLTIHSALSAVGLTATVSGALAAAGISANVLAGRFHDHFFVPWDRREHAVAVLAQFAATRGASARS